jgi:hypothetical protein
LSEFSEAVRIFFKPIIKILKIDRVVLVAVKLTKVKNNTIFLCLMEQLISKNTGIIIVTPGVIISQLKIFNFKF